MKCTWVVEAERPGSRIRLHIKDFETECGWDHLYIWDGDNIFHGLQVLTMIIDKTVQSRGWRAGLSVGYDTLDRLAPSSAPLKLSLVGWTVTNIKSLSISAVQFPLQAVYSGLVKTRAGDYEISSVPEIVGNTGTMLLHFYSDVAYNMTGFNISFSVGGCPSNHHQQTCRCLHCAAVSPCSTDLLQRPGKLRLG